MLRALGVVVLTRCLPLFLVALQAQDAQSAPMQGQGADVAKGRPLPAPEPDSMLIPSWYLKVKDSQKIPVVPKELLRALEKAASEMEPKAVQKETFQMGERDRVSVLGDGEAIQGTRTPAELQKRPLRSATLEKAETADYQGLSKNYILGTAAASAVLLLTIMACAIVMSWLRRKDTDKSKAESGEGAGRGERDQANTKFNNSCRLSPGIFAAELAQLYRNMGTDPAPLPACPSCSLADRASSRENWVSLDSLQPTPSWCPCYQYQQGYFTSEDSVLFNG
ncbi:uncharacterized protein LOC127461011 isoform X5 [Manacus candei]|uniref:uncharacterized protein LOC127461011 isoform X5 n=1 Tax=Manacus candei TaxID=415023 RepID=UPI002227B259|nr:uncharacterized protein LOC127461011 isoform X5 [Manacus candei]